MQLKTLKSPTSGGFTLVELILVITVIVFLLLTPILIWDPISMRAGARDQKRLSDMVTLERAISEYKIDNEAFPGAADTVLVSTSVALGGFGPIENASSGWIGDDLSGYVSKLPVDPTNDATYNYKYMHSGAAFEINTVLESQTELMASDGGDSSLIYELGNALDVIP